jgi:hypothetical protein
LIIDSSSSISSMEEIILPDNAPPAVSSQGGFIVPDFLHRDFLTEAECILYESGGHCLLQELDCLLSFSISQ